jgi:hypothetical protein
MRQIDLPLEMRCDQIADREREHWVEAIADMSQIDIGFMYEKEKSDDIVSEGAKNYVTNQSLTRNPSNMILLGAKYVYLKSLTEIPDGVILEAIDVRAGLHHSRPDDHTRAIGYSPAQVYDKYTLRGVREERVESWKKILRENGLPCR